MKNARTERKESSQEEVVERELIKSIVILRVNLRPS